MSKQCPNCGSNQFIVTAHIAQDWKVDTNGNFLSITDDCTEIVHKPDNSDMWTCANCGYSAPGVNFNKH